MDEKSNQIYMTKKKMDFHTHEYILYMRTQHSTSGTATKILNNSHDSNGD